MSLALTAFGTAQGYSVSKLCDYGSYSSNAENLGRMFARNPNDLNDGYAVRGNTLPNNTDNQSAPGSPSITGSPFALDRMFAANATEVFATRLNVSAPFEVTFERASLSTLAVGSPTFGYVTGSNGVGVNFYAGIGDRRTGILYFGDTITVGGSTQNLIVIAADPTTNTAVEFFSGDPHDSSTGTRNINGMGFPEDTSTIAFLTGTTPSFVGGATTYALKVFDVNTTNELSSSTIWEFDAAQYPTPQYGMQSFIYLRGDLAGKILVSGFKRTDALNAALFIGEFDLDTLTLNVVAEGEVKANANIRSTSLWGFGSDFVTIYDTRSTNLAQISRLRLPAGSTADNAPPDGGGGDDGGGWTRGDEPTAPYTRQSTCVGSWNQVSSCGGSWSRRSGC
jgi:hypothetical protein